MSTKYLKCSCENCGGRIEFPAEAAGTKTECPHCHWLTDLTVEVPEDVTATPPRGGLKWAVIGVFLILAALGIAAPFLLKRLVHQRQGSGAQRSQIPASKPAPQPTAAHRVQNDFEIGPVTIQTASGGSLTYATGDLLNLLARQRFAVRVELECLDATGVVIATASDYAAVIEPRATWQFRALLLKGKTASARITRITEQQ